MSLMRHLNVIFDLWIYALTAAMAAQSIQGLFEQVENINIPSDILSVGYSQSCNSVFDAAIVCLRADARTCKATIYDSASSSCHSFGVPLRGLFSASETLTGLTYLEKQCNGAQVTQLGSNGNCMQEEESNHTIDCHTYYEEGFRSDGVYTMYADDLAFNAWCEFDDDRGWTVIQRRQDGSQSFDLLWDDYKLGFGDLENEFWLGNDYIHILTRINQNLRIQLTTDNSTEVASDYSMFFIGNEDDNYRLNVSDTLGELGGSLQAHNGNGFSTRDRDNDLAGMSFMQINCAVDLQGGWWYAGCGDARLNGPYGSGRGENGITWYSYMDTFDHFFVATAMKCTRN